MSLGLEVVLTAQTPSLLAKQVRGRANALGSVQVPFEAAPESGIEIELSKAQIARVVREAAAHNRLLPLLAGIEELGGFRASPAQLEDSRLSRSVLRGLMVLASFPGDGTGRSVTEVARELGIGASMAHRYISTFVEVGLSERDPISREYRRSASGLPRKQDMPRIPRPASNRRDG